MVFCQCFSKLLSKRQRIIYERQAFHMILIYMAIHRDHYLSDHSVSTDRSIMYSKFREILHYSRFSLKLVANDQLFKWWSLYIRTNHETTLRHLQKLKTSRISFLWNTPLLWKALMQKQHHAAPQTCLLIHNAKRWKIKPKPHHPNFLKDFTACKPPESVLIIKSPAYTLFLLFHHQTTLLRVFQTRNCHHTKGKEFSRLLDSSSETLAIGTKRGQTGNYSACVHQPPCGCYLGCWTFVSYYIGREGR